MPVDLDALFAAMTRDADHRPLAEPDALRRAGDRRALGRRVATVTGAVLAVVLAGAVTLAVTSWPKNSPAQPGPSPNPVQVAPVPSAASTSPTPSPDNATQSLSSTPQNDTAGPPRCHTNELTAKFAGGQGIPGGGAQNLVLTNTSDHVCHLYGNPGMQLIDAQGHPLPTSVHWVGTRTTVILQPGQSGYANVVAYQAPAPSEGGAPCDPPAAGVLVTPPDETTQLTIVGSWKVCGNGYIEVGPMVETAPQPVITG